MTAQIREKLYFRGQETSMATEPLNQYLSNRDDIEFVAMCSACWRGYFGEWEIEEGRLYLIKLSGYIKGAEEREVGLNYLFPKQDKVFAEWFTGTLRIPLGELLEHVHLGYDSVYEKEIILTLKEGVVIDEKEVTN